MPIEYMFCFICSEQCIKIILSRKKCSLFSSVFKKIIPDNTTPTFQEVGWITRDCERMVRVLIGSRKFQKMIV